MSARRLALGRKKPRGAPRRLRALQRWAEGFADVPEALFGLDDTHYNWKLPLLSSMVEGRHARSEWRAAAAQALIDACDRLYGARPAGAEVAITCVICLPDMFTSEVCLYFDPDYLAAQTATSRSRYGSATPLDGRSLAADWGLRVPSWMAECGRGLEIRPLEPDDAGFAGERWYFGELPAACHEKR